MKILNNVILTIILVTGIFNTNLSSMDQNVEPGDKIDIEVNDPPLEEVLSQALDEYFAGHPGIPPEEQGVAHLLLRRVAQALLLREQFPRDFQEERPVLRDLAFMREIFPELDANVRLVLDQGELLRTVRDARQVGRTVIAIVATCLMVILLQTLHTN